MNYQRFIPVLILLITTFSIGSLFGKENIQPNPLLQIDRGLENLSLCEPNDKGEGAKDEQKIGKDVVIAIADIPVIKKTGPKKLSWSEWFATLGPAFKDYWTKDAERWQLPLSMFTLGAMLTFMADPNGQVQAVKDLTVSTFFSNLVIQYLRYFIVNTAHEGGHALVNYFVSGAVSEVYLGDGAADGVEVLPHLTLVGFAPSRGQTTNIVNPMISDELLEKNLRAVIERFQVQYPDKSLTDLFAMSSFQLARTEARNNSETKTLTGKLKYCAVMIAGVLAGLVTNGLVKLGMGKSIMSIDHVDIVQLLNLLPAAGFDGGAVISKVFEMPAVVDAGSNYAVSATLVVLFLKALSELNAKNSAPISLPTLLHAAGLALMNFSTNGVCHITGS